jgi:hypothetical protein
VRAARGMAPPHRTRAARAHPGVALLLSLALLAHLPRPAPAQPLVLPLRKTLSRAASFTLSPQSVNPTSLCASLAAGEPSPTILRYTPPSGRLPPGARDDDVEIPATAFTLNGAACVGAPFVVPSKPVTARAPSVKGSPSRPPPPGPLSAFTTGYVTGSLPAAQVADYMVGDSISGGGAICGGFVLGRFVWAVTREAFALATLDGSTALEKDTAYVYAELAFIADTSKTKDKEPSINLGVCLFVEPTKGGNKGDGEAKGAQDRAPKAGGDKGESGNKGAVAAAAVGGVLGLVIVLIGALLWRRRVSRSSLAASVLADGEEHHMG